MKRLQQTIWEIMWEKANSDSYVDLASARHTTQLPLLPRRFKVGSSMPALEQAISTIALLSAKVGRSSEQLTVLSLIRQADIVLCGEDRSRGDFITALAGDLEQDSASSSAHLQSARAHNIVIRSYEQCVDSFRLTPATLLDVHRRMTVGPWAGSKGRFRTYDLRSKRPPYLALNQAYAAESSLPTLIADICDFASHSSSIPTVLRSCLVFTQLCALRPFETVNLPVAEVVATLLLSQDGVPPLPLHARLHYLAALNDIEPPATMPIEAERSGFLTVLLNQIAAAANEASHRFDKVRAVVAAWERRTASLRKDAAARLALNLLSTSPVQTVPNIKKALGLPFQTCNVAVRGLQDAGVLTEQRVPGTQRRRIFVAEELIDSVMPFAVPNSCETSHRCWTSAELMVSQKI